MTRSPAKTPFIHQSNDVALKVFTASSRVYDEGSDRLLRILHHAFMHARAHLLFQKLTHGRKEDVPEHDSCLRRPLSPVAELFLMERAVPIRPGWRRPGEGELEGDRTERMRFCIGDLSAFPLALNREWSDFQQTTPLNAAWHSP